MVLVATQLPYASISRSISPEQETRNFDKDRIEELKKSGDFDYVERSEEPPSLLQRVLSFINNFLGKLFQAATGTPFGRIILYVVLFVLLLVAVVKLFGTNVKSVFYGSSGAAQLDFELMEEHIENLDLDALLAEALKKSDFRLAVRLVYLRALKSLSEAQLIHWEVGKTNYEYLLELKNDGLRVPFKELSYYFDYAWYGDFQISDDIFQMAEQKAKAIESNVPEKVREEE